MSLADKNTLPSPTFEPFWFTMPEYPGAYRWKWVCQGQAKTNSWLPFTEQDKLVLSGLGAPFGGIDGGNLNDWISLISEWVDMFPNKNLQITMAPECYRNPEEADIMHQLLLRFGFGVACEEQNFHVNVKDDFESLLHDSEKRRMRKARQYGLRFGVNAIDWESAHKLIKTCRERKGFPLSMDKESFVRLPLQAPQRYIIFSVHLNDELLATAVGVLVRNDIMYFFLPGDDERYLNLSPMVILKAGIYNYCLQQNVSLFDYGIGTSSGVPNEGLIRFKKNMGGILTYKRTYLKRVF